MSTLYHWVSGLFTGSVITLIIMNELKIAGIIAAAGLGIALAIKRNI